MRQNRTILSENGWVVWQPCGAGCACTAETILCRGPIDAEPDAFQVGDRVVSGQYGGTIVGTEEGMFQVRFPGGVALRPASELRREV